MDVKRLQNGFSKYWLGLIGLRHTVVDHLRGTETEFMYKKRIMSSDGLAFSATCCLSEHTDFTVPKSEQDTFMLDFTSEIRKEIKTDEQPIEQLI